MAFAYKVYTLFDHARAMFRLYVGYVWPSFIFRLSRAYLDSWLQPDLNMVLAWSKNFTTKWTKLT